MAFETLLRRYQRPVFGFIMRQMGDRQRAEDLFQETFLRVYDKIDSCNKPEAVRPWTFSIAANLCRNELRRRGVRRGEQPSERIDGHAGGERDPERSAIDAEARRRIASALEQLPDAQREVFVLYQYTRMSYDEIAEALELPLGTVKSRMNAALTRLRELLASLREG